MMLKMSKLHNSHNLKLIFNHLVRISKQITPKQAEGSDSKSKERAMTVSDLTESTELTEADSKLFEDNDSNKKTKNYKDACLL